MKFELYQSNLSFLSGALSLSLIDEKMRIEIEKIDNDFFPNPWDSRGWNLVWEGQRPVGLVMAYDDIGMIGYALYLFDDQGEENYLAHLVKIVISPNKREKGLGLKLLERSEIFFATGQKKINYYLEVEEGNLAAIALYRRSGYQFVHIKKNFYGQSRHAHIFLKTI